ncbi:MAG: M20/M25/M40 family metallo-hydrolase [Ignavibacteriaceae bacterium]|nr:M20/M25/M40 family metallo-hydrolase [Ignavibacteriaceae bacterium]
MVLKNMTKPLIVIIILCSLKNVHSQPLAELSTINKKDLLKNVEILTSEEFDGRLPGSSGYNKAANFIAKKFSNIELKPAGEDGYFQYLNVEYNKIDKPAVLKLIAGKDTITYQHGKDFVVRGFSGSGKLALPVVFCGYGISRPDLGYDDYDGRNLKNKVVLVFKQNPSWKINNQDWGNASPREKSLVAKKHGAKGILFVSLPNETNPQPLIGSVLHGDGEQPQDFPQLHISIDAANEFLSRAAVKINECQSRIDEKKKPFSINLMTTAVIEVNAKYEKSARTMNVVGLIEGSDTKLKNEFLIIGAHLDHVGSQASLLFPGANDNASGSAAVIELARAFKKNKIKPKRSIIFVLFASEEQGLLGSKHFVNNWKRGYDKIIAMINLDCIGYGDSIQVGNGKSSPELWKIAKQKDQENFKYMVEETWSGGGADATPFHEKEVPCLYFVTTNSYEHLHLLTDKTETLNPELYEKIVKLAFLTAKEVAAGNYNREKISK